MKLKRNNSFIIEPEEILLENNAVFAKRLEFSIGRKYVFFILGLVAFFMFLSLGVAFKLQIFQHPAYARRSEENSLRNIFLEAPRGLIFDRYGDVLADNQVYFEVLPIKENLDSGHNFELQLETLSRISGIAKDEISQKLDSNKEVVFENFDLDKAIEFKANEALMPGFKLVGRYQRHYPLKEATSHVLGYTGLVTEKEHAENQDLSLSQTIGKVGVELFYDSYLRGSRGSFSYQVDVKDDLIGQEKSNYFKTGNSIRLTLDAKLQEKIYQIFRDNVFDAGSGAVAVALEPKTGEILALVSYPGFDTSKKIWSDSKAQPFFNRAVSGEYSPGSTIKPFIALAALEEKIIDPLFKVDDTEGKITIENPYFPDQPYIFRDWKAHGFVNMEEAIADSANVYFYTIGGGYGNIKGLGVERIKEYLEKYGWGKKTETDFLGEKPGFLPDPEWKEKTFKDIWRIGDTYHYSIGQGYVKTTPIQLAANYQLFANLGKVFRPFLINSVFNSEGGQEVYHGSPKVLREYQIDENYFKIVNRGMERTVIDGSAAGRMAGLPFSVAGKTGSIQTSSSLTDTNAAFVSFIPAEDPKFLLLVLVESGGSGGATAVPLAKQILYWYWENRISE
ncbi:MAG: Penicillin-binding protein 2 [Parcubacteria group bacterium GW2011_GWC1_45_9]|nr:MAG: Penicillin-binding protein 2 [Parcubacteria group bacterium GW2011_GWA1_Parcubacteria_45_10]KKT89283.1 MAG: Penicillin-binding protein 2 [Parcubacteria group bacterium GW2011_GWB1_45_10]KKU17219.1 MAG: Penicillin-binding protein 2 [Parcubacteria group bacterium GW2011_GWC1_45_9]HCI05494.1 penicillin-binding protein 2 [Patescibacteria group bacterium]